MKPIKPSFHFFNDLFVHRVTEPVLRRKVLSTSYKVANKIQILTFKSPLGIGLLNLFCSRKFAPHDVYVANKTQFSFFNVLLVHRVTEPVLRRKNVPTSYKSSQLNLVFNFQKSFGHRVTEPVLLQNV